MARMRQVARRSTGGKQGRRQLGVDARRSPVYGLQPSLWHPLLQSKIAQFWENRSAKGEWKKALQIDYLEGWARQDGLFDTSQYGDESLTDGEVRENVMDALRCIQAEARRIVQADFQINLLRPLRTDLSATNWEAIDEAVRSSLAYIRSSEYAISQPTLKEDVGVRFLDGIVPPDLANLLASELDDLAGSQPVDVEPARSGKPEVRLIIDPFLALSDVLHHYYGFLETYQAVTFGSPYTFTTTPFRVSPDGQSVHLRGPINSVVGTCQRLGESIERVLQLALPLLEGLSDFPLSFEESPSVRRWRARLDKRYRRVDEAGWAAILDEQAEEKRQEEADKELARVRSEQEAQDERDRFLKQGSPLSSASPWAGEELKIIVKAFEVTVKPGETFKESWHHPALPQERVAASVLYHYEGPTNQSKIYFRRLRDYRQDFPVATREGLENFVLSFSRVSSRGGKERQLPVPPKKQRYLAGLTKDYPSDWEEDDEDELPRLSMLNKSDYFPPFVTQGSVSTSSPTNSGRILAFPQWLQTRIKIENLDSEKDADPVVHKFLQLFLVGSGFPSWPGSFQSGPRIMQHNLQTTLDVPPPSSTNISTLHFILPSICNNITGKNLPAELVDIIASFSDFGQSRASRESRRRRMRDEQTLDMRYLQHFESPLMKHALGMTT